MASTLGLIALGLGGGYLVYKLTRPKTITQGEGEAIMGNVFGGYQKPSSKENSGVITLPPDPTLVQNLQAVGGGVRMRSDGSYAYVVPSRVSPTLNTANGSYRTGTQVTSVVSSTGTRVPSGTAGAGRYVIPTQHEK